MCQLLVSNLNDKELNRIATTILIQVAASAGHRHGTGSFTLNQNKQSVSNVWKTGVAGDALINLGTLIRSATTDKRGYKAPLPILSHVRDASKNMEVSDGNAHPFEGVRFALAHNGRLWEEGESYTSAEGNVKSDSLRFLEELEAKAAAHPEEPVDSLLRKAMEKFSGKFAFLILDKQTGEFYAARGTIAKLHIAKVYKKYSWATNEKQETFLECDEQLGYLIATEKATLEMASSIITQVAQSLYEGLHIFTEVEEIPRDSVYLLEQLDIKKIGAIEETEKPFVWGGGNVGASRTPRVDVSKREWLLLDKLNVFSDQYLLSITDLDVIFYQLYGVGFSRLCIDDLEDFVKNKIPKLSVPKKLRKSVKKALGTSGIPLFIYKKFGAQFPWTLNEKAKIEQLVSETVALRK